MSLHGLDSFFFLLLNNILLSECTPVYLSILLLKDIFVLHPGISTITNKVTITFVCKFLCACKFLIHLHKYQAHFARLYTKSMFSFVRIFQIVFWSGCAILYSLQPWMRVSSDPHCCLVVRVLDFGHSNRCVLQFSCSVMSNSLRPHGLQHARSLCPSPIPRVYSDSCPLSRWCHPTISPSVVPSPPAFNLSQHQGLFKWVSSLHQVAKVLEFQLQHQSFQWILEYTDFL